MPAPQPAEIAAALARALGPCEVDGIQRVSGGASRETWLFDATAGDGSHHELVLRRDPHASGGRNERAREFELLRAAADAGVPVPQVRLLLTDDDGLGQGFVMDRIAGETIARKILRDDEFAGARTVLAAQCGSALAAIHAVDVAAIPKLPLLDAPAQLQQYTDLLDGFGEPHPAFEIGLRWLRDRMPEPSGTGTALVHGDFRNGNLIVGREGLRAVLDWELAHLGDPHEDLGWLCARAWRFGGAPVVGGFGEIAALLDAYETAGGARPGLDTLRYWVAFATFRWGIICMVQTFTHLNGLVRSVELAAIGRRVVETQSDLLTLLDGGGDAVQDRPSAQELVEAVREFLERDVQPALTGRLAFHTRVAVNVLAMVGRELELDPADDVAQRARLVAILGHDAETTRSLEAELAQKIRAGDLGDHDPLVHAHVRATVAEKLAQSNPKY